MFLSEAGTAYGSTSKERHPGNSQPVSDVPLSVPEAEYLVVKGALRAVPRELALGVGAACYVFYSPGTY